MTDLDADAQGVRCPIRMLITSGEVTSDARVLEQRTHAVGIRPPTVNRARMEMPSRRVDNNHLAASFEHSRSFWYPPPYFSDMLQNLTVEHDVEALRVAVNIIRRT